MDIIVPSHTVPRRLLQRKPSHYGGFCTRFTIPYGTQSYRVGISRLAENRPGGERVIIVTDVTILLRYAIIIHENAFVPHNSKPPPPSPDLEGRNRRRHATVRDRRLDSRAHTTAVELLRCRRGIYFFFFFNTAPVLIITALAFRIMCISDVRPDICYYETRARSYVLLCMYT